MSHWQPSASPAMLRARAQLNQYLRRFFSDREVLEVETPVLGHAIGTDPALDPLVAGYRPHPGADPAPMYLQTSPEFAMKRLLAAGAGPIYQLGKAFRNGECGARHNPEFTMLEWYRPGFTLEDLMDEVESLVAGVLDLPPCARRSYADLFMAALDIDPHLAATEQLRTLLRQKLELAGPAPDRNTCLDLLFSHLIEPGLQEAVLVYDYPASQSALARVAEDEAGRHVARRFELIIKGMEIANGYDELTSAGEQRARFRNDQSLRMARGLPPVPEDERLLAALQAGLPACAGVALGVDRLLMLVTGAESIAQVLSFAHENA